MRVLITGINGFVGPVVSRQLLAAGAEVAGTVFEAGAELHGVKTYQCDLRDFDSVHKVLAEFRPDRVVHLAGQSSVPVSFQKPVMTHEINYNGTLHLLEALLALKLPVEKVVHVSSADIYAASDLPIDETHQVYAGSPYAASKIAGETLCRYYASAGLPVVIARPFNHIGPGQRPIFFLPSVIEQFQAARRQGLKKLQLVVGNLEVERDFHSVEDTARAYLLLLNQGISGEVYNIGSGQAVNLRSVIELIAREAGLEVKITVDPARFRAADKPRVVCDPAKIKALGWQPQLTLAESIRSMLA